MSTFSSLLLVVPCLATPARGEGASEVVARLQSSVVQAREEAAFDARAARMRAAIEQAYDLEGMASGLLAEPWDRLQEEERAQLLASLARFGAATYAASFQEGGAERFGELASAEAGETTARVASSAVAGRKTIALEYRLSSASGSWRIVDVLVDGEGGLAGLTAELAPEAEAGWTGVRDELDRRAQRLAESASEVVARLQAALIETMMAGAELGFAGRRAKLAPTIEDTHDLASVAQLSVSRAWNELSAEERRKLVDAFSELSVATYAANFDSFGGERFAVIGAETPARGKLVKSTLTKRNGDEMRFDYQLHLRQGKWRIINITVDGVSDLALKRSEYGKILGEGGIDALLEKLNDRIARYAGGEKD